MAAFDRDLFFKALFSRNEDVLKDYLEGLDRKVPAEYIERLFQTIIQNKHYIALTYLIEKGYVETDLFEYDDFAHTPIAALLKPNLFKDEDWQQYLPVFKTFLAKIDDINEEVAGYNLLSYGIEQNAPIEILRTIIDAGILIGYKSRYGISYLYQYCQQLRMPQASAEEVIQLLLDSGVDVNAATVEQKTALFATIESSHLAGAKKLLEAGADVNQVDSKGHTPFFIAAVHLQNAPLVKLLLAYGTPDFTLLDKEGENLLNAYLRYIQPGASSLEILSLLLENGGSLTETSQHYNNAKSGIDWVAEKPAEILSFLLEGNHIDVNEQDNGGNTILIKVCAFNANYEESVAKDIYRKVKMLLKSGADGSIENTEDKKAVDYAMQDPLKTKIVEVLLGR